uniref:Reverse transcriptase domain-containing protein n=1 Tax=Tanacetum cinerariifolium TaxID=118510 RepID=A0A699IN21_TANCI|nr:reverse transcriptase domain-containing protein [Tanacetum cinerariifolium]
MVTPVEKRSSNKFCDFRNDKGHSTDECMQLKKQIEELVRAGKLSHLIKQIKQGRDQSKAGKKVTSFKDKPTEIYMVQSWQRTVKQKVTQSFERVGEIAFLQLAASNGTEGPLVIEAEMGEHMIYRMYIDGGSSMKILYEHCFNRLRPQESNGPSDYIADCRGGIATFCNTILILTECASVTTSSVIPREERTCPANFTVALHPDFPDQEVVIGGSLSDKGRTKLCSVLKNNLDIFAWQPSDMTRVPRSVAEHRLNIREGYSPVRQKKRGQAPERAKAIQAEVQKLVEAGITREVYYHNWLSNPVMVKKHDGSWRMCVDFTDLNKACTQDCYPLSEIDWNLAEAYEEKKTFHTGHGVYCYTKMPFGFKNAGATYQRLMDKAFDGQVGRNIEVYVDDLVVKSHTEAEMVRDIEETFRTLRKGAAQTPIYFISRALQGPKLIYSPMEKLVLSLIFAAKRLQRYIQAHPIVVITDQPIKQVMSRPDVAGQLQKWSIMLGEHNITYRLRTSVKGQILVDFLIEMPGDASQAGPTAVTQEEQWTLFTDGSSCVDGSGTGLILTNLEGVEFTYALRFQFAASNNEAEYEAMVAGLRIATQIGVKNVQVNVDSKLVLVKVLENKSIRGMEVTAVIEEEGPTWMTQLVDYLKEGILLGDEKEARKLRLKSRQYELMKGVLYRRSFLTPWLRCVRPLQADYVMREIHEGSCSMYAGPRSVVAKAIRLGYYWPTMHKDAPPWPFYNWGIDIAGPFPKGPGKVKKFVWDNIVCRFDIPGEIISDNGKQFSDNPFKDWCDKLNITQRFASVKHPQSNGLVERVNRSLGEGIKSRLGEGNKN